MFDHVPSNVFWPVFGFIWLVGSIAVSLLVGKIIRWSDDNTPRNRYVDHVDVRRCERTGSQGENMRRISTWTGR